MKKASTILFITMILSVISACGDMDLTESNSAHQRYNSNVSVWYVDDHSDLWTNFENLSDEYNSTNGKEQSVKISSRSFPDDQSLVHELMDAPKPPSVVLCSGETAAYLDFIGIPHSTNKCFQDWQLAHFDQDFLSSGMNDRGRFSVPISFSPEILFINNQLVDGTESYSPENLSTLEGLNSTSFYYEKETGKPFFTAESFSSIIRTTMASRGEDFHAKRNVDIDSDNFKYAYNILAQIAFHQALILSDEDASQLVLNGEIPCAIVRSDSLMKHIDKEDVDSYTFLPYPYLENGEKVYGLHFCSAMVTAKKEKEMYAAAEFLSWLCSNGDRMTADTGFFPSWAVSEGETHTSRIIGSDAFYRVIGNAFNQMEQTGHPYYSGNPSEYYENWQTFEQDYRERMSHLLDY